MISLAKFSGLSGGSHSLFDQSSFTRASRWMLSGNQVQASAYTTAMTRVSRSGTTSAVARAHGALESLSGSKRLEAYREK